MEASEIINFLDKQGVPCQFITYDQMCQINDVNQLLPASLILYQLEGPNGCGHFCCIFKNNRKIINYFDPLGYVVDGTLKEMDPEIKQETHHDRKYLTRLLASPGRGGVDYNPDHLQSSSADTCGNWCAIRLLCANMSNQQFAKCFMKVKGDRDKVVRELYNKIGAS